MTYWLYVDGPGSWSRGGKLYREGPHEVDGETYTAAQNRDHPDVWLFVSDEAPLIPSRRPLAGGLTSIDVLHGTEDTRSREVHETKLAELAAAAAARVFESPTIPAIREGRTPCPADGCEKDYASLEPLARHLATKHPELLAEPSGE